MVQPDGLEDVWVWRRPPLLLLRRREQPGQLEAALALLEVAQVKQLVEPMLELVPLFYLQKHMDMCILHKSKLMGAALGLEVGLWEAPLEMSLIWAVWKYLSSVGKTTLV